MYRLFVRPKGTQQCNQRPRVCRSIVSVRLVTPVRLIELISAELLALASFTEAASSRLAQIAVLGHTELWELDH